MKRKALPLILLLCALLAALYLYQRRLAPAGGVLHSTGTVEGLEINLAAKIAGRISSLRLAEGDTVRVGEVAFTLEDADLAAQVRSAAAAVERAGAARQVAEAQLANQRAGLESAAAEIGSATADLEKARVGVKDAERHLTQMRELYARDSVARESLDAALSTRESALAAVNAGEAGVTAAKARRRAAEAQLREAESQLGEANGGVAQAEADIAQWQAKLADATVVSPVAGTVVYKAVEQGETVTPGMTVLTVVDLQRLTVRVDIDETRLGDLRPGDKAVLQPIGDDAKEIAGHIASIDRYADFATQKDVTGGREDIRTFRVTVEVDEADSGLLPGMTVRVTIPEKTPEGS